MLRIEKLTEQKDIEEAEKKLKEGVLLSYIQFIYKGSFITDLEGNRGYYVLVFTEPNTKPTTIQTIEEWRKKAKDLLLWIDGTISAEEALDELRNYRMVRHGPTIYFNTTLEGIPFGRDDDEFVCTLHSEGGVPSILCPLEDFVSCVGRSDRFQSYAGDK